MAISCLTSYELITHVLTGAFFISRDDQLLEGMWAVVATVFVSHYSYQQSVSAAQRTQPETDSHDNGRLNKVFGNLQGEIMPSNIRQTHVWLSFELAFVGGYGDAASFVLAKTFTGHVTGNFVLGAIAVAAHDWRATLGHFSAIFSFLIGILLATLIARPLKAWPSWPLLPTIMGIEVILIVAASLAVAADVVHGVEIFVIFVSLALGLQNGAFRRVGGISVHTTYLTGMITGLISTEAEKYASEVGPPPVRVPDPKIGLLCGMWVAFVLGAGAGAAMVLHFKALGMLGAALLLITLIVQNSKSSRMTETS